MSREKQLITREILNERRSRLRGKVVSDPRLTDFDPLGAVSPTWVVNVDVGTPNLLIDVPIKISERGRMFAQAGSAVYLDTDARGRYQIVAPGDRTQQQGNLIELDEEDSTSASGGNIGSTVVREPFLFYQGTTPESLYDPGADAAVLVWLRAYDRLTGLPENIVVASDVDGAEVLRLTDQSGGGFHADATGVATENPFYRKFDGTNPNSRSTVDFDGSNDQLDFVSNIIETTPGEISIFMLLQKDAVGASTDVVLQTEEWRVFTRAGGDTWGVDSGAGVSDSGSTLGTSQTLIEIVATSFANFALYEDGILLGTFTPAAAGLSTGSSVLGDSSAGGQNHNGRIAEVLILDETVTATKRLAIESYFSQTINTPFAKWANGSDGFPRIRVFDADGNEIQ